MYTNHNQTDMWQIGYRTRARRCTQAQYDWYRVLAGRMLADVRR
jgi:hypothetical protein